MKPMMDIERADQPASQVAALGFVGLGNMGGRMAKRLLSRNYQMSVYNRTSSKTGEFAALGAAVAKTPRELAAASDVILVCVTNDQAQAQVMFGEDGVLAGAREGSLIIDLSTVSPAASRRVYQAAGEKGVAMIDAPVSGSTPQVEQGTLAIFVGGDEQAYQRSRPILAALGQGIFYMGPSGMGATMKLVVNVMLGVGMQALAEAITFGEKAGIERNTLLDILGQTSVLTGGQKAKLANVRSGRYPEQFGLAMMYKDFGLIHDQAVESAVPMPATAVAQQIYKAAIEQGLQGDFSIMIQFMQELAGSGGHHSH